MRALFALALMLLLSGCLEGPADSSFKAFQALEAGHGLSSNQLTPPSEIASFKTAVERFNETLSNDSSLAPLKLWVGARIDLLDAELALQQIEELNLRFGSTLSCTNQFAELSTAYATAAEKTDAALSKFSLLKQKYQDAYATFTQGNDFEESLSTLSAALHRAQDAMKSYCA